jgi:hypothetical protein
MIEWLKNLELEFVIIFGLLAILVIVVLVILIKAQRTLNLIGRRALILTEDLLNRDGKDVLDIMVANTSYVNVEAAAIGLIYQKTLLPLREENTIVLARDSFKLTLPIEELRAYVLGDQDKVKTIKIYVEDSLGRRSYKKAINSMIMLKKLIRAEKKAQKIEEKNERYETGHYHFIERVGLVFKVIFSPFSKLFKSIRTGLNRKLKRREERLELKRKETAHQTMLREIAEEERREEERSKLEKRLMEEKKKANVEARLAALKRKEEARKAEQELKKSEDDLNKAEEEMKLAEAEAELHRMEKISENEEKTDEEVVEKDDEVIQPTDSNLSEEQLKTDVKQDESDKPKTSSKKKKSKAEVINKEDKSEDDSNKKEDE